MKAFISYSLNDQEQYLATLLSYKLREQGFSLITSNGPYNSVDITTRSQIFTSQVFVGLVSHSGLQWQRVIEEYDMAVNNNTPAILLVEEGVYIAPDFEGNYVRFNRRNPQPAIEEIRRRMYVQQPSNNDALGWVLGGAALLAVIALLANGNKK